MMHSPLSTKLPLWSVPCLCSCLRHPASTSAAASKLFSWSIVDELMGQLVLGLFNGQVKTSTSCFRSPRSPFLSSFWQVSLGTLRLLPRIHPRVTDSREPLLGGGGAHTEVTRVTSDYVLINFSWRYSEDTGD